MTLKAGDTIDRYTLIRPLGEGGQGSVWEAEDPVTGKKRALKLGMSAGVDERALQRMRREATMLSTIRHPSLVRCYGMFEDLDRKVIGLVLDLVEGRTLADAMDDPSFEDRHRRAAFHILAGAVADVHARGLVHRDIKLDNVIVTDDFLRDPSSVEHLKLVDFGIAAMSGNPHKLTSTGGVIGTLAYLAPELVDPATWGRSDEGPRRDLFALGVLGYQLFYPGKHPTGLTGRATIVDYARAYKAASSGVIPWPPPGLDARPGGPIAHAISSCLGLHAHNRPADGDALDQILRGAAPPSMTSAAKRPLTETEPSSKRERTTKHERKPSFEPQGSTAPMPVGWAPSLPSMVVKRPNDDSPPRARAPQSSFTGIALVALALGGATAAFVFLWRRQPSQEVSPSLLIPVSAPQPTAAPAPLPSPRSALHVCCFGGGSSCDSGRGCSSCGSSKPLIPEERTWSLRLAKVGEFQDGDGGNKSDLTRNPEYALVNACVQRGQEEERCVLLADLASKGPQRLNLRTTTAEIRGGYLTISLRNTVTQDIIDRGSPRLDKPVLTTALCAGLALRFPPQPTSKQRYLTLYLDDE